MIVPDACALSPPRNACRGAQVAGEYDLSLNDGVEKRCVSLQGCVRKVCHRNGHEDVCMHALIMFWATMS